MSRASSSPCSVRVSPRASSLDSTPSARRSASPSSPAASSSPSRSSACSSRSAAKAPPNGQVFVPLTGLASRFRFLYTPTGDLRVTQIDVQTAAGADTEAVKQQITDLLLFRHQRADPDFTIQSQDDLLDAASEVANTLSILLGSIAGISLLVGGIGVMNIMLVSVTERTREIGIRRAVGATAGDIVTQFVTEALTLSLLGGLAGVVIGIGASLLVDGQKVGEQEMTTVIQAWSIAAAFGVAAGIGLLSGIYPAWRATVIDPIAALRNE